MGWTLGPVETFSFNDAAQDWIHPDGNNLAWNCNQCNRAVLFVYRLGGAGSSQARPTECRECGARYYLEPEFPDLPNIDGTLRPAEHVKIRLIEN